MVYINFNNHNVKDLSSLFQHDRRENQHQRNRAVTLGMMPACVPISLGPEHLCRSDSMEGGLVKSLGSLSNCRAALDTLLGA